MGLLDRLLKALTPDPNDWPDPPVLMPDPYDPSQCYGDWEHQFHTHDEDYENDVENLDTTEGEN